MSGNANYYKALEQFYARTGMNQDESPASMVRDWQAFVDDCANGYSFDISEYDNDLQLRRDIQLLLEAPELQSFAERAEFEQIINHIDDQFRPLLSAMDVRPAPTDYWWDRGILRNGGSDYVADLASLYGIKTVE